MDEKTQAALDKFNKAYFPHAKERKNRIVSATPAVDPLGEYHRGYADGVKNALAVVAENQDPLLLAGAADLGRQCDELRRLLREAVAEIGAVSQWAHELYEFDGKLVDGGVPEDAALIEIVLRMDDLLERAKAVAK